MLRLSNNETRRSEDRCRLTKTCTHCQAPNGGVHQVEMVGLYTSGKEPSRCPAVCTATTTPDEPSGSHAPTAGRSPPTTYGLLPCRRGHWYIYSGPSCIKYALLHICQGICVLASAFGTPAFPPAHHSGEAPDDQSPPFAACGSAPGEQDTCTRLARCTTSRR